MTRKQIKAGQDARVIPVHAKPQMPVKSDAVQALDANHLFKAFSQENNLRNPSQIFAQEPEERDRLLAEFCDRAVEQGFTAKAISVAMLKWHYVHRVSTYVDVHKDQAACAIALSGSSRVKLWRMLAGGTPIVQHGMLLNGVFANSMTSKTLSGTDIGVQQADIRYLPDHSVHGDGPQAPFIIFGARGDNKNFKERWGMVIRHRKKFEASLSNSMAGHYFKIDDPERGETVKFRLLCAVFNHEEGRLYVVTDKNGQPPAPLSEWVRGHLRDVLSASAKELAFIHRIAAVNGGLLDKLRNPRVALDYQPWEELLKDAAKYKNNFPAWRDLSAYKVANKIWRYAMITLMTENIQAYESTWQTIKEVEKILEAAVKLSCNDGREPGELKFLAAMLSKDEFRKLFSPSKTDIPECEMLLFTPHYNCGMLTTLHTVVHAHFRRLSELIQKQYEEDSKTNELQAAYERDRQMREFSHLVSMLEKRTSSVISQIALGELLPKALLADFEAYAANVAQMENSPHNPSPNHNLAKFLYDLFYGNNDKLRAVVQRGLKTGLLINKPARGLLYMPAAEVTYQRLNGLFDGDFQKEINGNQVNSLVMEEAVRQAVARQAKWAQEMGVETEIFSSMANNTNGRQTVIPDAPKTKAQALDFKRTDAILTAWFTPEEIGQLGIATEIEMPS